MREYLQSLGAYVWEIIEGGYQYTYSIPIDDAMKQQYETNEKEINSLLGRLT